MGGDATWISRAFMHLEALCRPETPYPDDYNADESTRRHLPPRPPLQSGQFGLHKKLALLCPEKVDGAGNLDMSFLRTRWRVIGKYPKAADMLLATGRRSSNIL
jgi:hypothetical protein